MLRVTITILSGEARLSLSILVEIFFSLEKVVVTGKMVVGAERLVVEEVCMCWRRRIWCKC